MDWWRSRQDDLPSRSEAMRRLIESGLDRASSGDSRFGDGEKPMLSMLCDISRHMKIKDGIDPEIVASALYGGHNWALKWELQGVFHDHEDSERAVSETVDVLDMWFFIESAYAKLSKKDKERIKAEAEPVWQPCRLPGFDGNYETEHLGIARFLIQKMGRFSIFQGMRAEFACAAARRIQSHGGCVRVDACRARWPRVGSGRNHQSAKGKGAPRLQGARG